MHINQKTINCSSADQNQSKYNKQLEQNKDSQLTLLKVRGSFILSTLPLILFLFFYLCDCETVVNCQKAKLTTLS